MDRTTLGDFELTIVSDGTYVSDAGAFFGAEYYSWTVDIGQPAAALAAIARRINVGLATARTEHRFPSLASSRLYAARLPMAPA